MTVVWDCLCLYHTHGWCVVLVHNGLAHGLQQGGGYIGILPDLSHMLPRICKAFNSPVIIMYQSQDSALWIEMAQAQSSTTFKKWVWTACYGFRHAVVLHSGFLAISTLYTWHFFNKLMEVQHFPLNVYFRFQFRVPLISFIIPFPYTPDFFFWWAVYGVCSFKSKLAAVVPASFRKSAWVTKRSSQ